MTKAEKRKLVQENSDAWNALKLWEKFKDNSPEDMTAYCERLSVWSKVNHICMMFMSLEEIAEITYELESKESA